MASPCEQERRKNATCLKSKIKSFTSPVPYLSHSQFSLLRSQTSELLLIDVRESEESEVSTLEGAVSTGRAQKRLQESDNNMLTVVCFCTVGFRSGIHAKSLPKTVREVYNYSVMEHIWGHGKLISPDGHEQRRVHAYHRRYMNVMPETYEIEVFGNAKALMRGLGLFPWVISSLTNRDRNSEQEMEPIGS